MQSALLTMTVCLSRESRTWAKIWFYFWRLWLIYLLTQSSSSSSVPQYHKKVSPLHLSLDCFSKLIHQSQFISPHSNLNLYPSFGFRDVPVDGLFSILDSTITSTSPPTREITASELGLPSQAPSQWIDDSQKIWIYIVHWLIFFFFIKLLE